MRFLRGRRTAAWLALLVMGGSLMGCSKAPAVEGPTSKPAQSAATSAAKSEGTEGTATLVTEETTLATEGETEAPAVVRTTTTTEDAPKVTETEGTAVSSRSSRTRTTKSSEAPPSTTTTTVIKDEVKLGKYAYVWGDEFDGNALDLKKWQFGSDMNPAPDMAAMDDDPDFVKVADGMLQMNAKRYYDPDNSTVKYGVARALNTRNTLNYKYGYLEMRAKVPYKVGAWPALWLKSNTGLAPRKTPEFFVEVDVFEVYAKKNELMPCLHKWFANGKPHTSSKNNIPYIFFNDENLSEEFHVYGFEWTPTEFSMYVDGSKYTTYDLKVSFDDEDPLYETWHDNLYIVLDNWLFTPLASYKPNDDAVVNRTTKMPIEFFVDWIRLYQEPGAGELYTAK